MLFFKACPKCPGDMQVNRDQYGEFIECLQCGLLRDIDDEQMIWRGIGQPNADRMLAVQAQSLKLSA